MSFPSCPLQPEPLSPNDSPRSISIVLDGIEVVQFEGKTVKFLHAELCLETYQPALLEIYFDGKLVYCVENQVVRLSHIGGLSEDHFLIADLRDLEKLLPKFDPVF
jgi:hypothetical protein